MQKSKKDKFKSSMCFSSLINQVENKNIKSCIRIFSLKLFSAKFTLVVSKAKKLTQRLKVCQ